MKIQEKKRKNERIILSLGFVLIVLMIAAAIILCVLYLSRDSSELPEVNIPEETETLQFDIPGFTLIDEVEMIQPAGQVHASPV